MRIALLGGGHELAGALGAAGIDARVVESQVLAPAEALLARRGFTPGLTRVAPSLFTLLRGGFDLTHAFSAAEALAALAWRRWTGGPVVFTCTEALDRSNVADRRLRLAALRRALEHSDALTAADEGVAEALLRWTALDAPVLDAAGLGELYRALAGRG